MPLISFEYYMVEVINMDLNEIKKYLKTDFIGKNLICLDETDSTNCDCKRHWNDENGTTFAAELQTAGRGRRGHSWLSPEGNGLWFSVLLKPNVPPEKVSQITLIAGLAVSRITGGKIKYPNDIVIGGKKVCGILTELIQDNSVVCGIGINVNNDRFDDEISARATSLRIENGVRYNREKLFAEILNEFEKLYDEFLKNGLNTVIDEYKNRCVTWKSEVTVSYENKSVKGICSDITADGNIVVDTANGSIAVNSGEVSVRGVYGYV